MFAFLSSGLDVVMLHLWSLGMPKRNGGLCQPCLYLLKCQCLHCDVVVYVSGHGGCFKAHNVLDLILSHSGFTQWQ